MSSNTALRSALKRALAAAETSWFHGSYDARNILTAGGFEPRTRSEWNAITHEFEEGLPKPVYFTPSRRAAGTYADDMRAFNYQDAEPRVIEAQTFLSNPLSVDAGGRKFSNVPLERVRAAIEPDNRDEFDRIIQTYGDPTMTPKGLMRTGTLESVAHKLGHDGFDVNNVVDDYNAEGAPISIRAVFDPVNIKLLRAALRGRHA